MTELNKLTGIDKPANLGLASYDWMMCYRTSSTMINGHPVDMLHDFYIPALCRATRYDRVAGYFRSSSLAAASQGFSSFVERQGKMRLIVGADLEIKDVQAILNGDAERLSTCLHKELEEPGNWPQGVSNGVTLLAWMVANGYLEVKVAFRRHAVTGEALTFEDNQDGYVHEKWFVLHDDYGHRLYGSGTLNESKTALMLNAENVDVHCDWWGDMEYRRTQQAVDDFEHLWAGHHPCLPVYTLPEAVKKKLLTFAEGIVYPVEVDGRSALSNDTELQPFAMERLQFAVLRDAPHMPGGKFVGLHTAPVTPWPHQEIVAQRLIEGWPYSYLLCDEVGLGKTIEAGLAIRSLYLSGLARRILVAAPISVARQWHREMASKMLLPFALVRSSVNVVQEYIHPQPISKPGLSIYEADLTIISSGLIPRQGHQTALLHAAPFDITLVDEAHAARRKNPAAGPCVQPEYGKYYTALRDQLRKQSKSVWLATATPMQIHPVEVSDLVELTNRVGVFQYDPILLQKYAELIGQLVEGKEISEPEWQLIRQAVKAIQTQDPMYWEHLSENVVDPRRRYVFERWLQDGYTPHGRDLETMLPVLFCAAPLSRVMMRHSRQLLDIYKANNQLSENLAQRHIRPLNPIYFTNEEKDIYDDLEIYLQRLSEQIKKHGNQASRQMVSFLLSFFRLRFASSIYAFRETMRRRLQKVRATLQHELILVPDDAVPEVADLDELVFESVDETDLQAVESLLTDRTIPDLEWERDFIKKLLTKLDNLVSIPDSKMMRLLSILDERREPRSGRINQLVIFTRFVDTLQDIVAKLRSKDNRMLIGTYSGQGASYFDSTRGDMISITRESVKERFRQGEIDVLVCTDAAAEGLNLQSADLLVNYDLPWNPMKVEQRIGRIDRIGQKHEDIFVENLCYAESAEETVYGRLLDRLQQARLIVGPQQLSLLPIEPDDFVKLAERRITLDELQKSVEKKLQFQQRFASRIQMDPQHLYNIYMRQKHHPQKHCPVTLNDIWDTVTNSPYLAAQGGRLSSDGGTPVFLVPALEGIPGVTALTISRSLYESGQDELYSQLHFASYGDYVFDSVLQHMSGFPLPNCIRRLSFLIPELDSVEVCSYAVAILDPEGSVKPRLVCSYQQLQDVVLAEDYTLTEEDIEPLQLELQRIVREEFKTVLAAPFIEIDNQRSARAQEVVDLLIASDLLEVKASGDESPKFWRTISDIKTMLNDRSQLIINNLPADVMRNYQRYMLFNYNVSRIGDTVTVTVPRLLLESAVAAAERLADGERGRRRDLTVAAMLRRLQTEATKRQRLL